MAIIKQKNFISAFSNFAKNQQKFSSEDKNFAMSKNQNCAKKNSLHRRQNCALVKAFLWSFKNPRVLLFMAQPAKKKQKITENQNKGLTYQK